jgi:N-methylhydantoinase B/oxoprolinase/acetone carboxylase alpha subunit
MTNTRLTDPEVLEFRYPVVVVKYLVNAGAPNLSWRSLPAKA